MAYSYLKNHECLVTSYPPQPYRWEQSKDLDLKVNDHWSKCAAHPPEPLFVVNS